MHMHIKNIENFITMLRMVAIFVFFCDIYVKTPWNLYVTGFMFDPCVHLCTMHVQLNNMDNVLSILDVKEICELGTSNCTHMYIL